MQFESNNIENYEKLNDQQRRQKIIDFLSCNQGCNKELLVKGLSDYISKKTIYKILDEQIEEKIVRIVKEKANSRDYKLYLYNENPLIVISKELEEFKQSFFELLDRVDELLRDEILRYPSENKRYQFSLLIAKMLFYRDLPLAIINYLIKSYSIKVLFILPTKIKDKKILRQLSSFIFTELSDINLMISERISPIEKITNSNTTIEYHEFEYFNISVESLFSKVIHLLKFCKDDIELRRKLENVLDKLWLINADVQKYMHPEPLKYQLDYKYGIDDWRKYIEILEKSKEKIAIFKKKEEEEYEKADIRLKKLRSKIINSS